MEDLGYAAPDVTYKSHTIMGKTFDPATPEAYVDSFAIGRADPWPFRSTNARQSCQF